MKLRAPPLLIAVLFVVLPALLAGIADVRASEPVTAIVTAYEPEWKVVLPLIADQKAEDAGGVHFVAGTMSGMPVLLVESGMGPVNAVLATQIAIDRFHAARIIVVGIAGGVDSAFHVGDVTVPERWSEYLFSVFARSTSDGSKLPGFATNKSEHFGMIFPQAVPVGQAPAAPAPRQWLDADAGLLRAAREVVAQTKLDRCRSKDQCLSEAPRLIVGGNGVSGSVFVDNASFRDFISRTYQARAVDMESAAVAHVASSNRIPFIAIRSLSDLAGGQADPKEMEVFQDLAARNATASLSALLGRLHEEAKR